MIQLIVEKAGRRQPYSFPHESLTIGRAEDNDLRISSRFVSQHHCRLESEAPNGARLIDLDSQNGTLVNGKGISQCRLKPGDCIEIGPILLWYQTAPKEQTVPLDSTGEVTEVVEDDIQISTRVPSGVAGELQDALAKLMVEFRTHFGNERGVAELERAVEEASKQTFPRAAFERSTEAARLVEVIRAINSSTDLGRILAMIIDGAISLTDSERGFLVLRDENGAWKVRIARNFDQEAVRGAEHKISRSIAEQVARQGKPVCSVNAQEDQRFGAYQSVSELRLRSIVCVPLRLGEDVVGTLYLDNRFKDGVYTESELSLLESFADHAALALENARLFQANTETQTALEAQTIELEELEKALRDQSRRTAEANAADPKALTRDGLQFDYGMIVGESPAIIEVFRLLDRVISSDLPVLVTGESGTGKELVAQAIHINSPRKEGAFVRENCAAIPASLLESELFGYKKGAFTGATADRKGLFEQADGGTIFLDEIGEMSLDMQSKLLRVLQNGEIRPVGAQDVKTVNVRLISATNRDLRPMVREKSFREDLFFRINVICVEVPPLRDRAEDIPLLASFFLEKEADKAGQDKAKSIDPLAMKYLLSYHWPGNIRELQNEIQRAVALSGAVITMDDLSREVTEGRQLSAEVPSATKGLKEMVKLATHQKEREIILRTLEEANWQKSLTARTLKISRPTLDQKIRTHGLAPFIERGRQKRNEDR